MRSLNKTKFSEIIGIVGRKGRHRISRLDVLDKRRAKKLEDLGVRPLSRKNLITDYIRPEHRKIYEEAYLALKNSNKSWATESEIRSILYSDKDLSRIRGSEIIEIMRSSGVKGFKRTDELTSGEEYSERMLGVLNKKHKGDAKKARDKQIAKIMNKDKRSINVLDIDPRSTPTPSRPDAPMKVEKIETRGRKKTPIYTGHQAQYDMDEKKLEPSVEKFDPSEFNKKQKPRPKSEDEEDDEEKEKEIPFNYNLDDF